MVWNVERWECGMFEMSDIQDARCGMFRMGNGWELWSSGCGIFLMWDIGNADVGDKVYWGCGMLQMWDSRSVGCDMFVTTWDAGLQNVFFNFNWLKWNIFYNVSFRFLQIVWSKQHTCENFKVTKKWHLSVITWCFQYVILDWEISCSYGNFKSNTYTHKKKQSKVDYKNYRPISLLSNIEKLMHERLSHFLDDSRTWFVGLLVILRWCLIHFYIQRLSVIKYRDKIWNKIIKKTEINILQKINQILIPKCG